MKERNGNERHIVNTYDKRQRKNTEDGRRGSEGNLLKVSEKLKLRRWVSWDLAGGDLKAVLLTPGECYSCPR